MQLSKAIKKLFQIETNPVVSLDESKIPKTCTKERSRVVLDNISASPVPVHYRKKRKVVEYKL
jgi:hypothetical protein